MRGGLGENQEGQLRGWCNSWRCTIKMYAVFFFFLFLLFSFLFLFFFLLFGTPPLHREVPRLGSIHSYSCWPTPQPQQCRIPAASATYTIAHGNTRSLTHCDARDWTHILMDTSWVCHCWAITGTPWAEFLGFSISRQFAGAPDHCFSFFSHQLLFLLSLYSLFSPLLQSKESVCCPIGCLQNAHFLLGKC